jgi:hypothetical protein
LSQRLFYYANALHLIHFDTRVYTAFSSRF